MKSLPTKALYNMLRINWLDDPALKIEQWKVEDYRILSLETLFGRLKSLGLSLDEKSLLHFAENCDSPEDLVECLWLDPDDLEGQDRAYLLFFELWRRLLPDKRCLSIFCDELDHRINLYDHDELIDDDPILEILSELEDILDTHVDRGADPKETFQTVSEYCANDLENFIYDFLKDLINSGNELTASELLDGFYQYISDVKWFDFLRVRLVAVADEEKAHRMMQRLLEQLQEEPDLDLILEIVEYLSHAGNIANFVKVVKQMTGLIDTEEHFQDLLASVAEFYRCMDREEKSIQAQAFIAKRAHKKISDPLDRSDQDLVLFREFLAE
jgi:hypothetical protein